MVMAGGLRRNLTVLSLVGVSLIGLILASILMLYTPTTEDLPWRRPIIGSTYALICVLGAVAVFFPKKCSRLVSLKDLETAATTPYNASTLDERRTTYLFGVKLTHGHHPSCEIFSDHEFQIGRKTFCAGCTGLLIGALVSLVTVSTYFLGQVELDRAAVPLLGFGFIAVIVGLLTPILVTKRSTIRLATNALFILGMSSILVGADALLRSVEIDIYLIALGAFWLMTRISISRLNHEMICTNCEQRCIS